VIETLKELWAFMWARKLFWLAPILVMLLMLAALFWFASTATVVSPFVYAL